MRIVKAAGNYYIRIFACQDLILSLFFVTLGFSLADFQGPTLLEV